MTLVFDTSVIIDVENSESETIERLKELSKIHSAPGTVTFMNYLEFINGLHIKSIKNKEKSMIFIEMFHFLSPTKKTAVILSDLKRKYDNLGKSFSLSDLLIASQVIENNMVLVTRDKSFQEIEEMKKIIL